MNSIYLDFFTFKTVYILFFCVLLHIEKPKIKGKMPEWSIGTVSKTVVPVWVPRVRIPLFPQIILITKHLQNLHPILHPEMAVILGVLLSLNDT